MMFLSEPTRKSRWIASGLLFHSLACVGILVVHSKQITRPTTLLTLLLRSFGCDRKGLDGKGSIQKWASKEYLKLFFIVCSTRMYSATTKQTPAHRSHRGTEANAKHSSILMRLCLNILVSSGL